MNRLRNSGYFKSGNVEGETQQCCHCAYTWVYKPGSGMRHAVCRKCWGFTCSKKVCMTECIPQEKQIEFMEGKHQNDYIMTEGGLIIPK